MHFVDALYTIFLLISGSVTAFVGGMILRRRSAPGAGALLVFLAGSLAWTLSYAMFWVSITTAAKRFWLDMTYFGVVITPSAMLAFILYFTHRAHLLAGWRVALLAIEPLVTMALLWTDSYHGLFYGGKRLANQSLIYDGGPWFWTNVIYSYLIIVISIWLLLRTTRKPNRLQRDQAGLVLIGCLFPVASNLVAFLGFNPFPRLDVTPISFTFTGVFLALGLVYYRLLDLIPIGRDALVENMHEGMFLLDHQFRLLDINQAARSLLNLPPDLEIGQRLEEALRHWPEMVFLIRNHQSISTEMALKSEPIRYLQVQVMPVNDPISHVSGTLVICHDITQRKLAQIDIENQLRQIEELQATLREQAIRDGLTGAFNMRYLQETLPREIARAARDRKPLSLVMLDVDTFKNLNDSHGHPAGDAALMRLCAVLSNHTRNGDLVVRYGGDEFLVLLAATDADTARQRAEAWRETFESEKIEYEGENLRSTISLGIASFPEHASTSDQLIRMADAALYQAKSEGRNRAVVYLES